MGIKSIFSSLFKIFFNTKKGIHIIVFLLSAVIIALLHFLKIKLPDSNSQMSLLTGISILASFFLLTLQNINFKYLNHHFKNEVKISKSKFNKESVVIRNTIFSLAIASFALTGICFILNIFNVNFIYVLIFLIVYLFAGIIYTIILWNYFASKNYGEETNND